MLENCTTAQERWGGVSNIIDKWLQERQSVLVLYHKLTAANIELSTEEREDVLRRFCQLLVDYVSAGHFEVYEQLLAEGKEFDDQEGLQKAKGFYQEIDETTENILDFNDKYQETDDLTTLSQDLSVLGEAMATRFESEDAMIEVLHNAHKNQLA